MTTLVIRPRQPHDLPALADILVRVHEVDGYPVEGVDDPKAWLTPPHQLAAWTAVLDDTPIGQVGLIKPDRDYDAAAMWLQRSPGAEIEQLATPVRLFVDPDHRGLGAGKQLMRTVLKYANAHALVVVFDVMLKDRAAIHIYESLGCQKLGTIDHRHRDDLVEPAAIYLAPSAS